MEHGGYQVLAYTDLLKHLDDGEDVTVKAGDLKEFLRRLSMGVIEPGLAFRSQGQGDGRADEAFCSITWQREDVIAACKHTYGIELDRDAAGVEEMIDDVISGIGDGLQDRSTEFGYDLIYDFLPAREQVESLAQAEPNTKISYLYRDDGDRKTFNEAVVSGRLTDEEVVEIVRACGDGGARGPVFIPCFVGLDGDTTNSDYCGPWFEVDEGSFMPTAERPHGAAVDARALLAAFREQGEICWKLPSPSIEASPEERYFTARDIMGARVSEGRGTAYMSMDTRTAGGLTLPIETYRTLREAVQLSVDAGTSTLATALPVSGWLSLGEKSKALAPAPASVAEAAKAVLANMSASQIGQAAKPSVKL